jgi:hypothetical protein
MTYLPPLRSVSVAPTYPPLASPIQRRSAPPGPRYGQVAAPVRAPQQVADISTQVTQALRQNPEFRNLEPREREALERNLAKITGYLSDPAAGLRGAARAKALAPHERGLAARGLADDQVISDQNRVITQQNDGGQMDRGIKNFSGDAANAGSKAMADQVQAINFPKFVASLITGVFNAIVDASIKQMKAYGDMLASVAKAVDQFAQDHITMPQAKQNVQKSFPNIFDMIDKGDGTGSDLKVKDGVDAMPDFKAKYGLDEDVDPTDPEGLDKIVIAAQLQLARQRQQQLASMVMMGVNRIVVTDGKINAKVFIEVKTKDSSTRNRNMDRHQSDTQIHQQDKHEGSVWGTDEEDTHDTRISTASVNESGGNVDQKTLDTKAQLTGEVSINFKSDYFPLEKLTSPADLTNMQEIATPKSAKAPSAR